MSATDDAERFRQPSAPIWCAATISPATPRPCSCRPMQRRALLAIYAFNVEISRVREQVSQPLPGEMRLQWWTDMLAGAGHGGVEGNPVAAELLLAIRDYRLPVQLLSRLIDEHQFDLYNDPMPSMAALEGYINDTSSALFSLGAQAAAPPSEEIYLHLARHAGFGARHRAGDCSIAAGCGAAAIVRAAATAAATRHRDGRDLWGKADAERARRDRSVNRRGGGHILRPPSSCLLGVPSGGEANLPAARIGSP